MKLVMRSAKDFWGWLDGKKTVIGAVVVFVGGGLKALGKIDEQTYEFILALGGAISIYGLRDAIRKIK